MATKIIGSTQTEKKKVKKQRATDVAMKPLANKFLDNNPELNGTEYPIFSGRLTEKGFLLLQCKEFSVLMPGGTEVATTILDEILPELNGKKANRMVAILNRGNRFGADIGVTDSEQIYYVYDEGEETFFLTETKPTKESKKGKKLSLSDFGTPTE